MRFKLAFFLILLAVLLAMLAGSGLAQWESHHGSDERTRHCVPGAGPGESDSALLYADRSYRKGYSMTDVWSLDADYTPWEGETERVLVSWEHGGHLIYRDQDFRHLAEYNLNGSSNNRYGDFMRVDDPDELQFMATFTADGAAVLYDLPATVSRNYESEAIVPEASNPLYDARGVTVPYSLGRYLPAMGDFTGDGGFELVFGESSNEPAWQALRADGEMIARRVSVDSYDRAWPARVASQEDGQWYIYFATAHASGMEPLKSRLYKLSLEPNVTDVDMPFQFKEHWVQEFPRIIGAQELFLYDLTGDGYQEIIMAHHFGEGSGPAVSILDRDGTVLYQMDRFHHGRGAVGDLNKDGVEELVWSHSETMMDPERPEVAGPESWITGIQWNGNGFEEIYEFLADDEYGGIMLAVCDLTGDGNEEVVVAMGDYTKSMDLPADDEVQGKMRVLSGDGEVLWEFSFLYDRPMRLAVDDLTGDGAYELIVGADSGFTFVFSPYVEPTREDYGRVFEAMVDAGKVQEGHLDWMWSKVGERYGIGPEEGLAARDSGFAPVFVILVLLVGSGWVVRHKEFNTMARSRSNSISSARERRQHQR